VLKLAGITLLQMGILTGREVESSGGERDSELRASRVSKWVGRRRRGEDREKRGRACAEEDDMIEAEQDA
jgi:hypothetical protein